MKRSNSMNIHSHGYHHDHAHANEHKHKLGQGGVKKPVSPAKVFKRSNRSKLMMATKLPLADKKWINAALQYTK